MRYVEVIDPLGLPSLRAIEQALELPMRAAFAAVRHDMQRAYRAYDAAAPSNLHNMIPIQIPPATSKLIDNIFSRRLGVVKNFVNALNEHLELNHDVVCPYCNLGEQWEHDHYLPKSIFPEFALYFKNLVPICKVCNGKKLTQISSAGMRLFIHPFFELNGVEGLLIVNIQFEPKISIRYDLNDPGTLPADSFNVLQRHYDKLDLARRYARQASGVVARLVRRFRMQDTLALGKLAARSRLRNMARDAEMRCGPNHWESVLFDALSADDAFIDFIFDD